MRRVFNRRIKNSPYSTSLQDLWSSNYPDDKALALNLRYDHRVSPDRDQRSFLLSFRTAGSLKAALDYHQKHCIRCSGAPEFANVLVNQNNFVQLSNSTNSQLKLATVIDLNGLREVYDWDRNRFPSKLPHPRLGGQNTDQSTAWASRISNWLDDELLSVPPFMRKEFAGKVLETIGEFCLAELPHNPMWATVWTDFKDFVWDKNGTETPDRWQEVLGLRKEKHRWLAVVRYSLSDVKHLFRPTQLDAGADPTHFPSPPPAPPDVGGHPVTLLQGDKNRTLLPEFIHRQLVHLNVSHVMAVGRTTRETRVDPTIRQAHRRKLASAYPGTPVSWFPER